MVGSRCNPCLMGMQGLYPIWNILFMRMFVIDGIGNCCNSFFFSKNKIIGLN